MLSAKNRALLKGLANHIEPTVTVGKGEVDDTLLSSLNNSLSAHELVKVRILNNSNEEKEDIADKLAKGSKSELVAVIGHIVILYRPKKTNPVIVLTDK